MNVRIGSKVVIGIKQTRSLNRRHLRFKALFSFSLRVGVPEFCPSNHRIVPEWIYARVLDVTVGFQVVSRIKFFRWVAPFMPAVLAIMAN